MRWLALSVFCPSQQLGKSRIRMTRLPRGQSGYLSVSTRLVNPLQVHWARAFAPPLVAALASPVISLRNRGIAVTLATGFPGTA
nr:hypothetical protein GCM10020093_108630 [Planobispora longispora]